MGPPSDPKAQIIIVGAGVFGLSTAYELACRGYSNITILDRSLPPVADGSSVDVSRVIRWDYADPFYAEIAQEAVAAWQSEPWAHFYHSSGIVLSTQSQDDYIDTCKVNLRAQGHDIDSFDNAAELRKKFPMFPSGLGHLSGYINRVGGWANAEGAIRCLAERCVQNGVSFLAGRQGTVKSLLTSGDGSKIEGVMTLTGPLRAAQVILATGAWTNRLVDLKSSMDSSGQPVGFVQLTPEEAASLKGMPVLINLTSGFFIFPPTPDTHQLKVARHSHGFESDVQTEDSRVVSSPNLLSVGAKDFIPQDAEDALRTGLRYLLPQFADRPWVRRRLCWYTDTPEGDFVVDHHPDITGLFVAAGGAGQ